MIYEEEISIFTGIINYVHACRGCGDSDSKDSKDKDSSSVVSTDSKADDSSIEDSEESTKPSGGDDEQTPAPVSDEACSSWKCTNTGDLIDTPDDLSLDIIGDFAFLCTSLSKSR